MALSKPVVVAASLASLAAPAAAFQQGNLIQQNSAGEVQNTASTANLKGPSAAVDTVPSVSGRVAASGVATLAAAAVLTANARRSSRAACSKVAVKAFESELGAQPPLGFWDPLGLSADGDTAFFKRRREVEIKHGRVSMYACMGYIVPEYFRFPGYLSPKLGLKFDDVPNGLAAISKVPAVGWQQIVAFLGIYELFINKPVGDMPGNYGKGNLGIGLGQLDEASRTRKLSAELANGRLAMMAIIGMFFQDGLTGSAWGDWANYTDSPLRAFESERGVQPPVGFWDPLGLAADGDVATFRRRRAVELKHGRICMLACIGYIVPEYYKFPGFVSPSLGLKFSDVPNGLGALSKVPPEGWLQIGLFLGHYEGYFFQQDKTRAPGDFEGYGFLGVGKNFIFDLPAPELSDEDKEKKLSAELANGRLAMVAIIGMFYQDGLTGSAWGDWASYTDSPLRAFEGELGVQPPVGFWDPVGFTSTGDAAAFKRRREVEIKHGRISMYAAMGYITPEYFKFPGYLSPSMGLKFSDVPNGLAAISEVPLSGWAQIISFLGFYELFVNVPVGDEPGNYGKGSLGLGKPIENADLRKKKLSAELANGRLAMMAIIGMFYQDGLTGSAWGDWSLYTDSPLRAFEDATGVQPPLGFWDPLGYTSDANVFDFNRRRETELKHGRVAMFACMGYIAPEYFRFEGYCSPSYGVKFSDIPNGFAALGVVPALGIFQIILFAGLIEITIYNETVNGEPGNYGAGNLGLRTLGVTAQITDPEVRKKKLNAELANGRLAMMAIIGMFFQEGLTGSAWGDWANYTDSPLRAFDKELGVTAPLGYFDPLGMSSDGDMKTFTRRRQSEIKNGRVAMYACMGWIVPEWYRFPGFVSPSKGLKFADIPNGMAALKALPTESWVQMGAFVACLELGPMWQDKDRPAGDFKTCAKYGFPMFFIGGREGSDSDPVKNERALNAEINNGRLAMVAITGMVFQNGMTGTTGPEMWTPGAFESERGAQPPLGFFDPLGLSADGDVATFKRRRQSEIKHGRISMLATMGYITPEITGKFPGYLSPSMGLKYADIPNGLGAISKVPAWGWVQIFLYTGLCETLPDQGAGTPGEEGDLGFKVWKVPSDAPETRDRALTSELANGRLAMMAIIGMFYQDGLTGSAWGDWSLYTDSPLRAFESELGAQPPLGFFDPLGLTGDGSVEAFKRRRQSEIKHGRIAMLATMGYITPELGLKFPGYLSPSMGIKFADVPNGLAAVSKVPAAGWAQILGYMAYCETSQDQSPGTPGAAGDFGFKVITSDDEEVVKRKLASELANGRLAMMAIIGMFYQDGLTGSPWGDWSLYTASPLR